MPTAKSVAEQRSLLIIDDEPLQRMYVREIARKAGFEVGEAATIEEATAAMAERKYNAVVLDLSLGDRDGVEVIRNIADGDHKPQLIVISGCEDRIRDSVISFAKAVGMPTIGELRKPIDIPVFKRALASVTATINSNAIKLAAPKKADIGRDDLAEAISSGAIFPVYQPQVDMKTGTVVGIETLARWHSKAFGSVSPVDFVPLADKFDLSGMFTTAILERAVADASKWCKMKPDLRIAVNVPANVLLDLRFPDETAALLDRYGMPPENLVIEVTESIALSDLVAHAQVMCRLRIKRIHLSLDDFGTEFSSLVALRRFPFTELKIDREFVTNADRDPYSWEIAKGIIAMAKKLKIRTVAEGVETQAVADMLTAEGADVGQGWLYARPVMAEEIAGRLG
jgi:EAL domain-containing protein (putative c-di-GMP-specific phosphodiesterase class I)/CheY-like chemotaxis protein